MNLKELSWQVSLKPSSSRHGIIDLRGRKGFNCLVSLTDSLPSASWGIWHARMICLPTRTLVFLELLLTSMIPGSLLIVDWSNKEDFFLLAWDSKRIFLNSWWLVFWKEGLEALLTRWRRPSEACWLSQTPLDDLTILGLKLRLWTTSLCSQPEPEM